MKTTLNLLLMILLLYGCGKDSTNIDLPCQEDGPKKINIRIHNLSAYEIVDFNYDNIQTFNSILPGATTSYMQLENASDVPSFRGMVINGENFQLQLIDGLGLNILEEGCYTYLLHAFEYDEGKIYSEGRVYNNNDLIDFVPNNQDCVELEKSDCNSDSDKPNIRLKNSSAFDFCNVEIKINNQENAIFGNLASGETSCYISFESLKEYPLHCKFNVGDEEFIFENPTYYENLENLSAGFYTYNILIIRPDTKFGNIQLSTD